MQPNGSPSWSQIARALAALVAAVTISLLGHLTYAVHEVRTDFERLRGELAVRAEFNAAVGPPPTREEIEILRNTVATLASNVVTLARELRELRIE